MPRTPFTLTSTIARSLAEVPKIVGPGIAEKIGEKGHPYLGAAAGTGVDMAIDETTDPVNYIPFGKIAGLIPFATSKKLIQLLRGISENMPSDAPEAILSTAKRGDNIKVPQEIVDIYKQGFGNKLPKIESVPEFHAGKPVLMPERVKDINSIHGEVLHTTPNADFALDIARRREMPNATLNEFYPFSGQNTVEVTNVEDMLKLAEKLGMSKEERLWAMKRAANDLNRGQFPTEDPRPMLKAIRDLYALKATGKPMIQLTKWQRGEAFRNALSNIGVDRLIKPAAGIEKEIINLNEGGFGNVINRDVLQELARQLKNK